jgi:hypothetical protein
MDAKARDFSLENNRVIERRPARIRVIVRLRQSRLYSYTLDGFFQNDEQEHVRTDQEINKLNTYVAQRLKSGNSFIIVFLILKFKLLRSITSIPAKGM